MNYTEEAIRAWKPRTTRHCSECANARVRGTPQEPIARCRKGHGEEKPLVKLIRKTAKGFAIARECPDWESAS